MNPIQWQDRELVRIGRTEPPVSGWPAQWSRYGETTWSEIVSRGRPVGVHCFTDDRRFNSLWDTEITRTKLLQYADTFIGPDYSVDMTAYWAPVAFAIWRSNVLAAELARSGSGLAIYPALIWGPREGFLLDMMASCVLPGSWVAVRGPAASLPDGVADSAFWEPFIYLLEKIRPAGVLWIGSADGSRFKRLQSDKNVICVKNWRP